MNNFKKVSFLWTAALLLAFCGGNALATVVPGDAVVIPRVFNDSFASILTVNNSFPSLIDINDECAGPLGWANLHVWRFSSDGINPQEFENTDGFIVSAELTIRGSGDGEAGLQISPWWSPSVDGRFNVRTPDGEVAIFGGRLPFYSFTGSQGVSYVKGSTVTLTMIYQPNIDMIEASPATIEYIYNDGASYSSGQLPFDEGNPDEADPHGTYGILTPAQVGGHMQFNNMQGAGEGANLNVQWGNITFQDLGSVVATEDLSWGGVKALFRGYGTASQASQGDPGYSGSPFFRQARCSTASQTDIRGLVTAHESAVWSCLRLITRVRSKLSHIENEDPPAATASGCRDGYPSSATVIIAAHTNPANSLATAVTALYVPFLSIRRWKRRRNLLCALWAMAMTLGSCPRRRFFSFCSAPVP